MSEKNNTRTLSNDDYQRAFSMVVTEFDRCILRVSNENAQVSIVEKTITLYYDVSLSQFFILRNLKELTEDIFENEVFKSFLFELTELVSIAWSTIDLDYKGEFLNRLVDAIRLNRPSGDNGHSLVGQDTNRMLTVNKDSALDLFKNNVWLAVLYLLLVNFDQSTVYSETRKTILPKGKTNAQ